MGSGMADYGNPYNAGAAGYQNNAYDPNNMQSSELFKTLLQQSMQQGQNTGLGGVIAKLLGTYMGYQADPNAQGSMAYSNNLGSDIGSGLMGDIAKEYGG